MDIWNQVLYTGLCSCTLSTLGELSTDLLKHSASIHPEPGFGGPVCRSRSRALVIHKVVLQILANLLQKSRKLLAKHPESGRRLAPADGEGDRPAKACSGESSKYLVLFCFIQRLKFRHKATHHLITSLPKSAVTSRNLAADCASVVHRQISLVVSRVWELVLVASLWDFQQGPRFRSC